MTDGNDSAIPLTEGFTIKAGTNARRQIKSAGGLTKREYMATHLLAGLAAHPDVADKLTSGGRSIERYAIMMADALIEELNK